MKKLLLSGSALLLAGCLLFSLSCKKEAATTTPTTVTDDSQAQQSNAADESSVGAESDQAVDDANNALSGTTFSGKTDWTLPICDATIMDSSSKSSNPYILITYNGNQCLGGKTRTGTIKIVRNGILLWKQAGASFTLTLTNYKVTRIIDGKSFTFNGSKTITNVSGGVITDLFALTAPATQIVHSVKGDLVLKFDADGTSRIWHVDRTRTYTKLAGTVTGVQISVTGNASVNSLSNVVVWGTNRNNQTFYTQITTPLVINSICGWSNPTSGVKVHTGPFKELKVTFGLDSTGTSVTSGCASSFKLNWTNANGAAKIAVISYK